MKYQLNINLENFNLNHAGTKAVADCEQILKKRGYKAVTFSFNKSPYFVGFSFAKLTAQLLIWTLQVKPGSLIVTQYPLIGINRFFKFFVDILKAKSCHITCIIHDINSLRYQESDQQVSKEIQYLNCYDTIITHNETMTQWLKSKGLTAATISIQIFDYLYKEENKYNRAEAFSKDRTEIVFAGNLDRGKFINKLFEVADLKFKLYGPTTNVFQISKQKNAEWKGTYEPEELVTKLEGTFGLIWDGDGITDCEGEFGNYIKYNNPHKLSLYIAAGLPVIIPVKAALSEFVVKKKIGICINSLKDIDRYLKEITIENYTVMLNNIISLKSQLKYGCFFSTSISCIEMKYDYLDELKNKDTINVKAKKLAYEKTNFQS